MNYNVKEIFYTLQGEGVNAGKPAVFCRFTGCNLWSGKEVNRSDAICKFCDTDFVGTDGTLGGKYATAKQLAQTISKLWPKNKQVNKFVVLTGGEPMLQVDLKLIDTLHDLGFEVAIETNGTIICPDSIDWICVSPKHGSNLIQKKGEELKCVFPQDECSLDKFLAYDFKHFLIQPMDGPFLRENTERAISYCQQNPQWKLSIQTHKIIGVR